MSDDGECMNRCASKKFWVPKKKRCENCDPNCAECVGVATHCTACHFYFLNLYQEQCIDCRDYPHLIYCQDRLMAFGISRCPITKFISKNKFVGGVDVCIHVVSIIDLDLLEIKQKSANDKARQQEEERSEKIGKKGTKTVKVVAIVGEENQIQEGFGIWGGMCMCSGKKLYNIVGKDEKSCDSSCINGNLQKCHRLENGGEKKRIVKVTCEEVDNGKKEEQKNKNEQKEEQNQIDHYTVINKSFFLK